MQNKNIFVDEVKILDLVTVSKNKIQIIEAENNNAIKIIYDEFKIKNDELINIFNQKEIIINKQYIVNKQEIEDKNIIYKNLYLDLESNYLKETEILVLELKESFNILKIEEENRFNQVIMNINKDKLNELEQINKLLDEANLKLNNQKESLFIEYEKMIDTNNKNLNQKIANVTSDFNLKINEVKNIFEQNKIKNDTIYSSQILDISNKYTEDKQLHNDKIEEAKQLKLILQTQLDNNLNNLKLKTDEYINNLELVNKIEELNNSIIDLTDNFNKNNSGIANKIIENQKLSINNKILEKNLEDNLILLNNIQNEITNDIINNKQFDIYSNKLNEIESDFIKKTKSLTEENIVLSDKNIENIIANIINMSNINSNEKKNELSKINSEFKTNEKKYISDIDNKKVSIKELQLELDNISEYIVDLNSNIKNKTTDEINILLQKNKKIALEQATKISNEFLNINQTKYEEIKSELIKNKNENMRILNLELESYEKYSDIELTDKKNSLDTITSEVNEYNSIVKYYNQQLENLNKQMKEDNDNIKFVNDEIYTTTINEQINKIKNNLNLNLNELKSAKSIQKNNYNIEINNLEASIKKITSDINDNTSKLSNDSEYINRINTEFETLIKENNDKQDKAKLEETDRLTSELNIMKKEMETYNLLITNLNNSKKPYLEQLASNSSTVNTMDLLLKIQEIDNTLHNITNDKNKINTIINTNEEALNNINIKYNKLVNEITLVYLEDLEKKKVEYNLNNKQYAKNIEELNVVLVDNNNKLTELYANINKIDSSLIEEQKSIILNSDLLIKNKEEEYNALRIKNIKESQQNILNKYNIDSISLINNLKSVVSSIDIEEKTNTLSELTKEVDILESNINDNKLSLQEINKKILVIENDFNIHNKKNEEFNNLNIENSKKILEMHYKELEADILHKYDINIIKDITNNKTNEINEINDKIIVETNKLSLLNETLKDLNTAHNNKTLLLENELVKLNNKMITAIEELNTNRDSIIKNNYNESISILTNEYNNKKNKLFLEYKDIIEQNNNLIKKQQENNNNIEEINNQLIELKSKNEISSAIIEVTNEQKQINLEYNTKLNNIKLDIDKLEKEKETRYNNKLKELQIIEINKFEEDYGSAFDIIDNENILNKENELLETKKNNIELKTKTYNNQLFKLTEIYQEDTNKYKELLNLELSKINDDFNLEKNKQLLEYEKEYNRLNNKIQSVDINKIEDKYNKIITNENNINISKLKELDNNLNNIKQDKLSELEKNFNSKINEYYINYEEELVLLNKKNNQLLEENKLELENNLNNNKITLQNNKDTNTNLLVSNIEKEKSSVLTLMKELTN